MISKKPDVRLLLDNIRSVHNVGSIFRTADTLGITHIYCVGTTPVPVDRFGRKRSDFAKVSLGAEESVPWEHVGDSVTETIRELKEKDYKIIALEQSNRSVDYKDAEVESSSKGTLIILGNEVEGVSQELLKECDIIAEIPVKGQKESLNVAVATGIFLYRLLDK